MDEIPKVKVVYGKGEFKLTEQELDRIITIASKKLRNEVISARLGFMPMRRNESGNGLKNETDIKVLKDGYESEFYRAMSEALIYAIETDMLGNYCTKSLPFINASESGMLSKQAQEIVSKRIDSVIRITPLYTKYLHGKLYKPIPLTNKIDYALDNSMAQ